MLHQFLIMIKPIKLISIFLLAVICSAEVFSQSREMVSFVRPGQRQATGAYYNDCVHESPEFPGGVSAMLKYINKERKYPRDAFEAGIEGRVVCGFIVDSDGEILNVTVHRGAMPSMDREAVRIIESMPNWNAGIVDNKKVPVYYMLSIPFRL